MRFCTKCGNEVSDACNFCPVCGEKIRHNTDEIFSENERVYNDEFASNTMDEYIIEPSTLQKVAKVFMIISCVVGAFYFLIPLCWLVPMYLHFKKCMDEKRPTSTAFRVCVLIFMNMVAGILLLVDEHPFQKVRKDKYEY